jgi:hypothetical protein
MGVLGLKLIAGLGALQRRTGTGLIDGHEQATIKAWSDSSEAFRHRNCVEKRRALESGCGQDSERYRIDMGATPPAKPKTTSDV